MKKRFRSVLRIFVNINQNSCTTDHGYLTDYEIRLGINMADGISDIFCSVVLLLVN